MGAARPIVQGRGDDAAWNLRKAVREAPRSLPTRRAVIAAEIMRKDGTAALAQLDPALAAWPEDGADALAKFRSNRFAGLLMFAACWVVGTA